MIVYEYNKPTIKKDLIIDDLKTLYFKQFTSQLIYI